MAAAKGMDKRASDDSPPATQERIKKRTRDAAAASFREDPAGSQSSGLLTCLL